MGATRIHVTLISVTCTVSRIRASCEQFQHEEMVSGVAEASSFALCCRLAKADPGAKELCLSEPKIPTDRQIHGCR